MQIPIKLAANLFKKLLCFTSKMELLSSLFFWSRGGMSKNSAWCEGIWKTLALSKISFAPSHLPPPSSPCGIHNECSLTTNFFSCNLGHFFLYLLDSFLRFMRDCKQLSLGNVLQKGASAETFWVGQVRNKCYGEQMYHQDLFHSQLIYFTKSVFSFAH